MTFLKRPPRKNREVIILRRFSYLRPENLAEAAAARFDNGPGAYFLAGGTDLLVRNRHKTTDLGCAVDLGGIPGLDGIYLKDGQIFIGAMTRVAKIEKSDLVRSHIPMLADAAGLLGSPQVRNLATIGGNLCNGSPSADLTPPLIALGATLSVYSPRGGKTIGLEEFFLGPAQTILLPDEILTGIIIPLPPEGARFAFLKHSLKKSMDIALVNVAAMVSLSKSTCTGGKIVLGAAAPTPLRAKGAEAAISGTALDEENIIKAAEAAAGECSPISDLRCSAEYRRELVRVLVGRTLRSLRA
jgi:carbon-monoxide dehydrogenase medium subunit